MKLDCFRSYAKWVGIFHTDTRDLVGQPYRVMLESRTDDDGADEVHARAAGGRSEPQCPIRRGFPNQPHLENRANGLGQPRAGQRLGLGP